MGKLEREMSLDAVMELRTASVGEFAERTINAEILLEGLENGPFSSRKDFCEFLDIGESTLTGWLKADRIPRAAKVAYVLLVGMEVLHNEINRLGSEARDLKVVEDGGKYLVVRFPTFHSDLPDEEAVPRKIRHRVLAGEIVARDIADAKTASMLVASSRMSKLLDAIYTVHEGVWEEEAKGGDPEFRDILTRARMELSLMQDPDLKDLPSRPMDPDAESQGEDR